MEISIGRLKFLCHHSSSSFCKRHLSSQCEYPIFGVPRPKN